MVGEDRVDLTWLRNRPGSAVNLAISGNASFIYVDEDGDGATDMLIQVDSNAPMSMADIML